MFSHFVSAKSRWLFCFLLLVLSLPFCRFAAVCLVSDNTASAHTDALCQGLWRFGKFSPSLPPWKWTVDYWHLNRVWQPAETRSNFLANPENPIKSEETRKGAPALFVWSESVCETLVSGTAVRATCFACLLSNTCFFLLGCKTTERKECAEGGWQISA